MQKDTELNIAVDYLDGFIVRINSYNGLITIDKVKGESKELQKIIVLE